MSNGERQLSDREQQVAALVCQGLSNKMIGRKLNVTEGTIKAHLNSIFTKLGVRSRYALFAVFVRSGAD
jgi:two-component system, NarL family, nitrate/nitrite response regulator NarL